MDQENPESLTALPIDEHLPRIVAEVARARAALLIAPPGAGKTTRVAPALLEAGPAIVLQPRRVAARAIARRIASERGWTAGEEVGWQVRFERRFTPRTRLLIVTEGILTARLQSDPLLTDFATIVLDEFHERSIHADLALALARQAWLARTDLRIVVMSATLQPEPLAAYLHGCARIAVPGRVHPVQVDYAPALAAASAVAQALARTNGDVLAFFPGAGEIHRAGHDVAAAVGPGIDLVPLHGSLGPEAQDAVFAPGTARRVILSTNIAETSITVPRVTAVVDTGLHKVARYDPARGIDSLDLERVTTDAADQRAGRAGRLAPGLALRLWDSRDRLRPHREPEIARIDLASTVLDVCAWGGDPESLEWFERPPAEAMTAATHLLERLGALRDGRISPLGRTLQQLPLHPRLAKVLIAADGAWEAAVACAALSERTFAPEPSTTTTCDLLSAVDRFEQLPAHVQAVARQIQRLGSRLAGSRLRSHVDERDLRKAILAGYPDRVAERRASDPRRLRLSSGTGAALTAASGVVSGRWLVALDVRSGTSQDVRARSAEARVSIASAVDRDWLAPTSVAIEHRLDEEHGLVRAVSVARYDRLTLDEQPAPVDLERAAALIADLMIQRGPSESDRQLLRRLAFAGMPETFEHLAARAAAGSRRLQDVSLRGALPKQAAAALDTLAPERLPLPSGRSVRLEYRDDGTVAASVKLQELFGLAETPRIGARREPVLLLLLAPNGRPVQTTRDLGSFWRRTYPEVRKELRGRYPKHAWPEDPWQAPDSRPPRAVRRKP